MVAPVRIGLIGAGFITELHAAAFAQIKHAEVVAITSRHGERAAALAQRFGIPHVAPSWEALLERPDLDVVTIAVPNDLHAPICLAAAAAGKHVIVEKPLCKTLDEADRMIAACRDHRVKLMYAETLVFSPKYERARQLVEEGALGDVYLVKQLEKHSGPHSPWFRGRQLPVTGNRDWWKRFSNLRVSVPHAPRKLVGARRALCG